jgi:aryl-alcohol dehydrogenase-like predicted oxidoreductase
MDRTTESFSPVQDFKEPTVLGRTGLKVGRLGVAASFGAPTAAFEEAFERGCNYFYWGSMRKSGMRQAIKNICGSGKREELIVVLQSYSRSPVLMEVFLKRALKALNLDHSDILLLGWHNKAPGRKILGRALEMKQKGLFRFLGLSGHNRKLFPKLAAEGLFDLFHVRYNAAHRGAETEIFHALPAEGTPGLVSYTATRWGQLLKAKKMPPDELPPPASSCYRFALSNPAVDVCITGPKNTEQMQEALRTLELGPLSPDEMSRMQKIGNHVHETAGKFF